MIQSFFPIIVLLFSLNFNAGNKIYRINEWRFQSTASQVLLAGGGILLGKVLIDQSKGPSFSENVDMRGKNVVITGGNTGLGKETACKLAELGANVVILSKNPAKGKATMDDIIATTGNKNIKVLPLDLNSLSSIKRCAKLIHEQLDHIDILVNNAGVMALPQRTLTADGFEAHMGINYLGHFVLTQLLLDLLQQQRRPVGTTPFERSSEPSRIINVASAAHTLAKMKPFETFDIQNNQPLASSTASYDGWTCYGNSKLCNILFTNQLSRYLKRSYDIHSATQRQVITFSCHPGVCSTELGRYAFGDLNQPSAISSFVKLAFKTPKEGAQTQIYLSASLNPELMTQSGRYFDNSRPSQPLYIGLDSSSRSSQMEETASQWLWNQSEMITGIQYPKI